MRSAAGTLLTAPLTLVLVVALLGVVAALAVAIAAIVP